MSDPISGGASKVAEQMLKEVQSAMNQADVAQQQATETQFNQVMEAQRVAEIQPGAQSQNSTDVIRGAMETSRTGGQFPVVPPEQRAIDTSRLTNGLKRIVEDVMQGQNKFGKVLDLAMSGREFSSTELLALQAGVYRFSQELELTSKVIEKGTSAIKQTLNTQV
ncbi:MAG: hypothetical protein VYC39_00955 [Myxococcota bacterium]|nr:hypothetical protein [Myxococcota bacterium]